MKYLFIIIFLITLSGCKQEAKTFNILIDNQTTNYQTIATDNETLVPIKTILDYYKIEYLIETNQITINDEVFKKNKKFLTINNKNLPYIENNSEIYMPLSFLTEKLKLTYIRTEANLNFITGEEYLIPYEEALALFKIGDEAVIFDVETQKTFTVIRSPGSSTTRAYVEPKTALDSQILFEINKQEWNHIRRAVLVIIDDVKIAGALTPHPCSGRNDKNPGLMVDNRSGHTGAGINYNTIADNNIAGTIHIGFYNSLIPGLQRIDEIDQHAVLKAASYKE